MPATVVSPDRKAEIQRRAVIGGVSLFGAVTLFRLTGPLDRAVEWPTALVYAITGAAAGAIFGALAKSDNRRMRIIQIAGAAIGVAVVFVLLERGYRGAPIYWWQM